jgi:hypothetical protein
VFTIEFTQNRNEKTYIVHAPGKAKEGTLYSPDGTGFKYIKMRLAESYQAQYRFYSEALPDGGWQTRIIIKTDADANFNCGR